VVLPNPSQNYISVISHVYGKCFAPAMLMPAAQSSISSSYCTSNETASEDPGSSKGKGSVSLKSAQTSNSGGTFGCH
jgi:hypothetical protein